MRLKKQSTLLGQEQQISAQYGGSNTTGGSSITTPQQEEDDHALGLKLFDLYHMLRKVNEENKKNAWKRELLKSI